MDNTIQKMFSSISKRYDFMNSIMTFGLHKYWRNKSVKLSGVKNGDKILDLGTGTGDFAIAFKKKVGKKGKVVAVDFSSEMLDIFKKKIKKRKLEIEIMDKDVMTLDFEANTFDFVTMAFGLRNFPEPFLLIKNVSSFLKSSGKIIILETGQPKYPLKIFYFIYTKIFIPLMGKIFTGNKSAYNYLINTAHNFPYGDDLAKKIKSIENIGNIYMKRFFGGAVYLYICSVNKVS